MLDTLLGVLGTLKATTPKVMAGIAIGSGVAIFASESVISAMGLTDLLQKYRGYIGGLFLVSVSVLSANLASFLWASACRKVRIWQRMRYRIDSLRCLTPDEKSYLIPYIENGENTMYYSIDDGVAQGLVAKDILYIGASVGSMLEGFAYNMQPWARKHLVENPILLEGAGRRPATARERLGIHW